MGPKVQKSGSWKGIWSFEKNLIHWHVLVLHQYEIANGFLTFLQKLYVWEKSGSWVIVQKPLDQ